MQHCQWCGMCLSVCRHHVFEHVINGLLVTDCGDKGSSGLCKIEIVKDEFHLENHSFFQK